MTFVKRDVSTVKRDVSTVTRDVYTVTRDVSTVTRDIAGVKCDAVCPNSTWGQDCKNTCSDCTVHGTCDPQTGDQKFHPVLRIGVKFLPRFTLHYVTNK